MSDLFDVDARAAEYAPVQIKLRGVVHTMAESAASVLALAQYAAKHFGEEADASLLEHVRPVFTIACPDGPQDLNAAEELALIQPMTEVLERLSALTFREEE